MSIVESLLCWFDDTLCWFVLWRHERAFISESLGLPHYCEAGEYRDWEEAERQTVPCRSCWQWKGTL